MKSNAKTKRAPALTSKELFLVRQYVRAGAVEDKIGQAARWARVSVKEAQTILKRPHVQAELALQKQILRMEQAKLDAQDINRREQQQDEEREVLLKPIERKALRRIEKLVEADPKELAKMGNVMQVLKMALVVTGTIRDGRTERLIPADSGGSGAGSGTAPDLPGWYAPRPMVAAEEAEPLYGGERAVTTEAPENLQPEKNLLDGKDFTANVAEDPVQAEVLEVVVERKGGKR